MAHQIVAWSPEALEDVDAIADYIARDSRFYAAAVVEKILAAAGLSDFPKMGRIVPELSQADIRECFVYSYRVIYKIEQPMILVIAGVHGKRLLDGETIRA